MNLAATAVLSRASRESLNVRGAFLHVATDTAAFAGTAVAGALILVTGWDRFDPIAEPRRRGADAVGELGPAARVGRRSSWSARRAGIDPEAVGRALVAEPDVVEVHDLHVWTVTSGFPALAAHVLVAPRRRLPCDPPPLERMLHERFGLEHTTLQVDHADRAC